MSVNNGIQNNGIQKSEDLDRLFDDFKKTIKTNSEQKTAMQDSFCDTKSLSNKQKRYDSIHVQNVLQKTYHLNGTDAKNVQAFVNALDEYIDEQIKKCSNTDGAETWGTGGAGIVEDIKRERKSSEKLKENIAKNTNITVGFLTKLKSLCAKIASFFGDNSKLEKLQNEGLAQLNDLKECLKVKQESQHFIESFVKANADKPDVIDGLMKIFKSEVLDGSLKIKDKRFFFSEAFAKSIDLNNKEEVQKFVKACLWADQAMVQESLSNLLRIPSGKIRTAESFSSNEMNNTLFKDVVRGSNCTFEIEGKEIKLDKNLQKFITEINSLSEENRDKIKSFCVNFPSQGCLQCAYGDVGQLAMGDDEKPSFSVKFNEQGDTCVNVKIGGPMDKFNGFGSMIANEAKNLYDKAKEYKPQLNATCEYNFTYKGGIESCGASASDVKVTKWEQEITFPK